MSEKELKPCPFCGRPGQRIEGGAYDTGYTHRVGCGVRWDDKCPMKDGWKEWYKTQDEADAAWNNRATPPGEVVPEGTMEALGKMLDMYQVGVESGEQGFLEGTSFLMAVVARHRSTQQAKESGNAPA